MKLSSKLGFLLVSGWLFVIGFTTTVLAEKIDVSRGWTIEYYKTSQIGIEAEDVFKQGFYIEETNQNIAFSQFANIGNATLEAKKELYLKKGHVYAFDLVYALDYSNGSGYIDFNGERHESAGNPTEQKYQVTLKPTEDTIYTISIGFDVKVNSVGYWKVGYNVDHGGLESLQSKVITECLDQKGSVIQTSQIIKEIGEEYETLPPEIPGYTLDEAQLPTNQGGIVTEEIQTVSYHYEKTPISGGDVLINYIDSNGMELHEPQVISGYIDEPYDASQEEYQLELEGYKLDQEQLPENTQGVFSDEEQVVTYVYAAKDADLGTVTVKYLDREGQEIQPSQIVTGELGSKYDVSTEAYKLTITDYSLVEEELPENIMGIFETIEQTVVYIYDRNPTEVPEESEEPESSMSSSEITSSSENELPVKVLLPQTGEKQTLTYFLVGSLVLLVSLVVIFLKKKTFKYSD